MNEKNKSKNTKTRIKRNWILGISMSILLAVVVFTNGFGLFSSRQSTSANKDMKIPLSEISDTAQWYNYQAGKVTVRFFAVRGEDGSIKTGFDACDLCYKFKKGYSQDGSVMVCNNCGNRYPITGLGTENTIPGGCWPGYLPSYIDGEYLVITKSDLDKGRRMFA